MSRSQEIADEYVRALEAYDTDGLRSLFHADAVWWINIAGVDQPVSALFDAMALEKQHVKDMQLKQTNSLIADEGFTLQFEGHGTTAGGAEFQVAVCFVVHLRDGLIGRLDEYSNPDQIKPLLREMFGRHTADA